jgi:hypothetical protein
MDFNAQLSKTRKKRALPPTLATPEDFAAFTLSSSNPLHKTTQVCVTFMCVCVCACACA